jgi:hypothetical protein
MSYSAVWINFNKIEELLELFEKIFSIKMSKGFLKWKYRDAKELGMGLTHEDKLVAFYGAMPRDIYYEGALIKAVQIGDVMVHPSQRGAFTKKGAFYRVAVAYINEKIGKNRDYSLAFGFPSKRAYSLGNRLDLYSAVDSLVELYWDITNSKNFTLYKARDFNISDIKETNYIWSKMAKSLKDSLMGTRDEKWLKERYLNHPDLPYTVLTIHSLFGVKATAFAVLKEHQDGSVELVDLIIDINLIPSALKAIFTYYRKKNKKRVFCWITRSHSFLYDKTKPHTHNLDIIIPFITYNSCIDIEKIKDRWFLMSGDTDFR